MEETPSIEGVDPHKSFIFLHGEPKIGKSSWFAQFDDVFFIGTEKGLGRLNVRKVYVSSWDEFIDVVDEIQDRYDDGDFTAGYLVIDTVDILFNFCNTYVCGLLDIKSVSDAKHGKGWARLKEVWIEGIAKLCCVGISVGFIGHSTEKEVKAEGMTYDKAVPTLQKSGFASLNGLCDYILHAKTEKVRINGKVKTKRLLYLRDSGEVQAGSRDKNAPEYIDFTFEAFLAYCDEVDETIKPKKKLKKKGKRKLVRK